MMFRPSNGRFFAALALSGLMLALAGCQSSGGNKNVLDVDGKQTPVPPPPSDKVKASDLLAYCPRVTLRDGTAYFNSYARGGQDDPAKLIYQAAITEVSRDCSRANGTLTMKVGVAGKIVPGPLGKPGAITMPIRVVVTHGDEVLYTKLHKDQVQVADTSAATQFVFTDPSVSVPEPSDKGYQVLVGFDEGPINAAKAAARPVKKKVRRVVKKPAPEAPAKPKGSQSSISDIPR
ncbi:hypothetical protein [Manganibacter manganicus]|nr:hypothetical protein [Pseudaminobacter manganicus]